MPEMYKLFFFQGEFKWKNNAIMMDPKSGMPVFNPIHASHPWWYDRQRLELQTARKIKRATPLRTCGRQKKI